MANFSDCFIVLVKYLEFKNGIVSFRHTRHETRFAVKTIWTDMPFQVPGKVNTSLQAVESSNLRFHKTTDNYCVLLTYSISTVARSLSQTNCLLLNRLALAHNARNKFHEIETKLLHILLVDGVLFGLLLQNLFLYLSTQEYLWISEGTWVISQVNGNQDQGRDSNLLRFEILHAGFWLAIGYCIWPCVHC